ncbi:hypothetical protein BGI41_00945 [Methanobrevibacter sp. 87.7]|uniref:MarR family winged helix-turn-helix transcriptional regulator n=1 Tax=Methanobrevibacter sp. 87.7 TaxID=387957 RepID=UPI000B510197|nr:MarR family winged helix-turn-helix transcriptional regulator [Methanobrevibacter sp. 87.7]OWT33726.1 hypothetical protein BGI41_00945 [Methanobrevibacter sp. 87.7]
MEKINKKSGIGLPGLFDSIHRNHSIYLKHALKNEDISFGQFPYLMYLYHEKVNNNDNSTQIEIANAYGVTEGTVARALVKMEENNIIEREENKENRREKIIKLTEKGNNLAKKFRDIDYKWEEEILKFLDNNKKEDFRKTIEEIEYYSRKYNNKIKNQ